MSVLKLFYLGLICTFSSIRSVVFVPSSTNQLQAKYMANQSQPTNTSASITYRPTASLSRNSTHSNSSSILSRSTTSPKSTPTCLPCDDSIALRCDSNCKQDEVCTLKTRTCMECAIAVCLLNPENKEEKSNSSTNSSNNSNLPVTIMVSCLFGLLALFFITWLGSRYLKKKNENKLYKIEDHPDFDDNTGLKKRPRKLSWISKRHSKSLVIPPEALKSPTDPYMPLMIDRSPTQTAQISPSYILRNNHNYSLPPLPKSPIGLGSYPNYIGSKSVDEVGRNTRLGETRTYSTTSSSLILNESLFSPHEDVAPYRPFADRSSGSTVNINLGFNLSSTPNQNQTLENAYNFNQNFDPVQPQTKYLSSNHAANSTPNLHRITPMSIQPLPHLSLPLSKPIFVDLRYSIDHSQESNLPLATPTFANSTHLRDSVSTQVLKESTNEELDSLGSVEVAVWLQKDRSYLSPYVNGYNFSEN